MLNSSSVFVRDNLCRWALGLFAGLAVFSGAVHAQSNTGGFDPGVDGVVYTTLVQPDGRILLGGAFASVRPNGVPAIGRHNLARFMPDGSLDLSFDPNLNGPVQSLALQPDGSIVIGGSFTTVDPNRTGSPVTRIGLARLNSDGTLDGGFNPNPSGEQKVTIYAVAVQDDGRIVFGGRFNALQPGATGSVVPRNFLARVNGNGSLDTAFDPNPNNIVYSFSTPAGGRVIAGGGFTQLQPNGGTEVIEVSRLARFNADGSYDPSFIIRADNRVMAQLFEADGSLLIAGDFREVQQGPAGIPLDRLAIARIQTDGNVDLSFRPNANGSIHTVAIQRDGRILVGGYFSNFTPAGSIGSIARNYLARINPDGSLDTSFGPEPNYVVHSVAVQANDSIIAAGSFTRFRPISISGSIIRSGGARLYEDGSLDGSFPADSGGEFLVLTQFADGSTLAAGNFSSVGGVTRLNLVKLGVDGVVDEAFTPITNDWVLGAEIDSEGRILIVGQFTQVNEVSRPGIARLNADGTLDESFYPNPNGPVNSLTLATDGKIVIGGSFTGLAPNESETGIPRTYMARLNSDGTVDEEYAPAFGGPLDVVYFQSDGKLLVAGNFDTIRPQAAEVNVSARYLVRLNPEGTLDEIFAPEPNGLVRRLAVQGDGKIVVIGDFSQFNPNQAEEAVQRRYLARLNADGTVDEGFYPNPDKQVFSVFVDQAGRVLIGGVFGLLLPHEAGDPIYRERFARLNPDGSVDETLVISANDQVQSFTGSGDDVLIGGRFTKLQELTGTEVTTSGRVSRLTADGLLDTSYAIRSGNPEGYEVAAMAPQNDGTILVGGTFSELGGGVNQNVARLFSDGNVDTNFKTRANGPVHALLSIPDIDVEVTRNPLIGILEQDGSYADLPNTPDGSELLGLVRTMVEQSDGKLIIGGTFSDGNFAIGPYISRFNTDGSIDTSFDPSLNGSVSALAVQSDGRILIGGLFTTVDGESRNRIARLNADGTLDTTFDPNANSEVLEIVIQDDGRILVAGSFTELAPNGGTAVVRNRIARILPDGAVDPDFVASPNARVLAMEIESDGQILVGGEFESFATADGGVARSRIARLTPDGSLDEAFTPSFNGSVYDLDIAPDGRVLVAGSFTAIIPAGSEVGDFVVRRSIARLNADGTLDTGYDPNANGAIFTLYRQSDQQVLVGGTFTSFVPNGSAFAVVRNRLARLSSNGVPDTTFAPSADDSVQIVIERSDQTIAVGGAFSTLRSKSNIFVGGNFGAVNDVQLRNLARVDVNGTPDATFKPDPDRPVDGLAYQPDGSMVVVGQFSQIAGQIRNRIARFDSEGILDPGFDPDANGPVAAAVLQPDGKIVIGGAFTTVGGVVRRQLARLNTDGSLDTTFQADADGSVSVLAVRSDGSILVGGTFTSIGGTARANLALLAADGSVVAGFNPAPNGPIETIAVQVDGTVLVGGSFTSIAGGARMNVANLTASGSLDPNFNTEVNGSVQSVFMLETGRPFLGGGFTQVGGEARFLTVRLAPTTVAVDRIEVASTRNSLTWVRQGSLPEVSIAKFATSEDAREWVHLGYGSRASGTGNWEIDLDQTLPDAEYYYIRAEAVQPTTGQSSSGAIRSVSRFYGATPAGPSHVGQDPDVTDASDQNAGSGGSSSGSDSGSTGEDDQTGGAGSSGSSGAVFAWSELPETDLVAFTNLSARVKLGVDDDFITGFSITGPATKPVLLRAIGPGLAGFGVDDHAPAPQLEVYDAAGNVVAATGAWTGDVAMSEAFALVGAFPLSPSDADAALQVTLEPGTYTVRVSEASGLPGVTLAEIYDLEVDPGIDRSRLVNISSRGPVSVGSGVATGGFHLAGDRPAALLVRAVGPGLIPFGVSDAIADPVVAVRDFSGNLLAQNDDWESPVATDSVHPAYAPDEMVEAAIRAGAFSLEAGSRDGVVLIELDPGTYTVQAHSEDRTTGETIIEIYLVQ